MCQGLVVDQLRAVPTRAEASAPCRAFAAAAPLRDDGSGHPSAPLEPLPELKLRWCGPDPGAGLLQRGEKARHHRRHYRLEDPSAAELLELRGGILGDAAHEGDGGNAASASWREVFGFGGAQLSTDASGQGDDTPVFSRNDVKRMRAKWTQDEFVPVFSRHDVKRMMLGKFTQAPLSIDDLGEEALPVGDAQAMVRGSRAMVQVVEPEMKQDECQYLGLIMLVLVCCVSPIAQVFLSSRGSPIAAQVASAAVGAAVLVCCIYLYQKGMVSKLFAGDEMGGWCLAVSIYAFLALGFVAIQLCCLVTVAGAVGAAVVAQNMAVQQIRDKNTELSEALSPAMKVYYDSQEFKDKCNKLFWKADVNKNGKLEMIELREHVLSEMPDVGQDKYFLLAFDENGNAEIEIEEFYEMMKYFDMVYRQSKEQEPGADAGPAPLEKALAAPLETAPEAEDLDQTKLAPGREARELQAPREAAAYVPTAAAAAAAPEAYPAPGAAASSAPPPPVRTIEDPFRAPAASATYDEPPRPSTTELQIRDLTVQVDSLTQRLAELVKDDEDFEYDAPLLDR